MHEWSVKLLVATVIFNVGSRREALPLVATANVLAFSTEKENSKIFANEDAII